MTEKESTYKFDLMNLRFEFYRNEHDTWYVRVTDNDATEAGVPGLWVEQRLDQAFTPMRLMTTMAGLLLHADEQHEHPTNQALDPR